MAETGDLNQIKRLAIFAKVAELESFSKAAKALGMGRSSVSEQVSMLEAHLKIRLLHRTTRKISLTNDGKTVLPEAIQVLRSLSTINSKLTDQLQSGKITLTATNDFAVQWLTPRLRKFQIKYPNILFNLLLSDNELDLVEEEIDLGIRISFDMKDSSLISRVLFQERLQLFASKDFLDNNSMPSKLNDAANLPWIVLQQLAKSGDINLFTQNGEQKVSVSPTQFHSVDSPIVLISLIKAGLGIGLLFPSMLKEELNNKELVPIFSKWGTKELTFSVIYSSRKNMPLRVRKLLDFLLMEENK